MLLLLSRALIWLLLLPFQLILCFLIAVGEAVRPLFLLVRHQKESRKREPGPCSIVVLNWNGRHLLEESLPPLLEAVRKRGNQDEILLVDNGSSDDSVSFVQVTFPNIQILKLDQNLGFPVGNNEGARAASHDIVVFLNNDMIPDPHFLEPLLEPLRDPEVFASTSRIRLPEDRLQEESGLTSGYLESGYLHLAHRPVQDGQTIRSGLPVLWAGGGAMAVDRERFLQLGGFSAVFSPCYVEDTDLSYRAWRRGWRVVFAPQSRVLHLHRSSTGRRWKRDEIASLIERRKLWYLWRNAQLRTLIPHLLLLPAHCGGRLKIRDVVASFQKLPAIIAHRLREPRRAVADADLFRKDGPSLSLSLRFPPTEGSESLHILYVSAYLPHLGTHGGAGRVYQLMRRVAQKHDVSLVSFVEDGDEHFVPQVESFCRHLSLVPRRQFEPVSPFPYEPFEEFHSAAMRRTLERTLSAHPFDLVHFEWPQMAQYASVLPPVKTFMTEIEVNYAAHNSEIAIVENPLKKLKAYYNTLQTQYRELQMCKVVDRVICVTETDRDLLKGYVDDEKLKVVNTGVDIDFFRFNPEGFEPDTLVYVGAFRHNPNIDAMLFFCREIFPQIRKKRPQTRLVIVGSHPGPRIQALAQQPNISVTGWVEDVRRYYYHAQVIIVPLRTGVGIRGKVMEAWAAGRAMVATPLACQGLKVIHGENIMIASQPKEFARWCCALLEHPEFCRRLAANGRKTVEKHYTWEGIGDRLIRLYEEEVGLSQKARLANASGEAMSAARISDGV